MPIILIDMSTNQPTAELAKQIENVKDGRRMIVELECRKCKKVFQFQVKPDDFKSWQHGLVVQKAFPYLNADERELFISKICGSCFDAMYKTEEDDSE